MSNAATFGEVLRQLRTAASLSQAALAERAGLSLRGVSDLERGVRQTPHLATVSLLADALALSPSDRQWLLAAARPGTLPAMSSDVRAPIARLPTPLTAFLGRELELEGLVSLLSGSTARLVTLTGPGGTGKTRLALEVGTRLQGTFADGVVFADLAPLRDADLVMPTIAGVLGVRERLGQDLTEALARFLGQLHLLLIADNCEHVLAAAPAIAALLTACPRLTVLATSRTALHVRGERVVPLSPLPVPAPDYLPEVEVLARVPAVTLFIERAAAPRPDFALTEDNAVEVAAICRRLEGLPLAIELAAARISVLSPAALMARLEQRLPLLIGGSSDLPPRQQTMRQAIAWSYDLLPADDQLLFRCLAIFAGGWSLEAATRVGCGRTDHDVLAGLEHLTDASLVHSTVQPDGERRFTMLETIREFGVEQLVARGELEEVGGRYAASFLEFARAGGVGLAGAAPGEWLDRLVVEQGNLRAALAWLRDRGDHGVGLRLAAALGMFWRLRSAHAEGRAWLETFLAQSEGDLDLVHDRIVALRWAGELAGLQGDPAIADAHLTASLELARRTGTPSVLAGVLAAVGSAAAHQGDIERSIPILTEAVALSREAGEPRQLAFLLAYLAAAVGRHGDLGQARPLMAESMSLFGSLGDSSSFEANFGQFAEGYLAVMAEDYDGAEGHLTAALGLGRALESKGMVSATLACLGEVAVVRGQAATAVQHFREGLVQGWEGDYPLGIAWNLVGLVRLGSRGGRAGLAARLAGVLDEFQGPLRLTPPAPVAAYDAEVKRMRAALGEEAFAAAREAGRSMTLAEVVPEAVALADEFLSLHERSSTWR